MCLPENLLDIWTTNLYLYVYPRLNLSGINIEYNKIDDIESRRYSMLEIFQSLYDMDKETAVLLGVGLYMLGMLGVGYYASRRVGDAEDFIVAGRRLPTWLCTATLFATWFGGGTVMGAAGAAYEKGFLGVIADPFGAALCLFLAGLFFVKTMRRMRILTVSDFFEQRFGRGASVISSLCLVAAYVGWVGSLFVAIGMIFENLIGVSSETGIIIGTLIVLVYTTAGGMWAVSLTDLVQIIIVLLGLFAVFPIVVSKAGGWSEAFSSVRPGSFDILPQGGLKEWLWYIQAWIVIGFGNIPGQDLIQRSLSARNEKVAQNSAYLSGILYLTVGIIPVIIGIISVSLIPQIDDPEHIVPRIAMEYLPTWAIALFIGALLSAIMSSADSAILAPSSIIGKNVLGYFKPNADGREVLLWTRASIPVIGILSLFIALYFENIYQLLIDSFSVLLVSLFVPMAAGIWWRKANSAGAVASMGVGLVFWIAFKFITPQLPSDIFGVAGAAVAMFAVGLLTQRSSVPLPLADAGGNEIEMEERLGV